MLDGLDEAAGDYVRQLVPALPRFLVMRVLPGQYRRKRTLLWHGTPAAAVPSRPLPAPTG